MASTREVRYLDPAVLARLGTLDLKARTVVEGFLSGLHRSPFKGFSVEFAEYRQYIAGDDPATIDWKVYARSDRYYVKKFEEETNLECRLLVDVSASMGYGRRGVTKFEYGSYLAASLAYLMTRQRDAVGIAAFADGIVSLLPPSVRPGHLSAILATLDGLRPAGRTGVAKPFHQLADSLAKRGLVIVISDLLDDPDQVIEGLKHFRFRGTDVVVFHVLDRDELTFPFEVPARFVDPETLDEISAAPDDVRTHYLGELTRLLDRYERELRVAGIDYCRLDTAKPLDHALMAYLRTRARRH
ncbi:MAG: DUF58 domain-containing protein [Bacteroidales bacterium]